MTTALRASVDDNGAALRARISLSSCASLRRLYPHSQIGKLKMLKVLKINGNKIRALPPEIAQCSRLEHLYAGENSLEVSLRC